VIPQTTFELSCRYQISLRCELGRQFVLHLFHSLRNYLLAARSDFCAATLVGPEHSQRILILSLRTRSAADTMRAIQVTAETPRFLT
jgi:hypothetical protein